MSKGMTDLLLPGCLCRLGRYRLESRFIRQIVPVVDEGDGQASGDFLTAVGHDSLRYVLQADLNILPGFQVIHHIIPVPSDQHESLPRLQSTR
jgi:hypothetical protein